MAHTPKFKDSCQKMCFAFCGPGQTDTNPQKFMQTDKYLVYVWGYLQDYWELFGIFPKKKIFAVVSRMNESMNESMNRALQTWVHKNKSLVN
jgi:hypothetical protein